MTEQAMADRLKSAGHQLRTARNNANLTIEDVAKATGLDVSDISRMETGRIASPSLDKAVRYAVHLGISPNKLAALYGLWRGAGEEDDERVLRLLAVARDLPDNDKERLLDMVEVLAKHSA